MLPIFKQLAEEIPQNKIKLIKVDTDLHQEAIDKYKIQGVPLFGIFVNGQMVASQAGALSMDKLKQFIYDNLPLDVQ